jgi:hypothetical protein
VAATVPRSAVHPCGICSAASPGRDGHASAAAGRRANRAVGCFIPYGLVGYLLALSCLLVALVRARRRLVPAVIIAAVAIPTAFHLAWLGPLFVNDHRAAASPELRLMILNMSHSESDTREVAERAAQADLVILSQTTPAALTALKSFGWHQRCTASD